MELEQRIMAGAEELFCRFGIKNVTMDDIARHLGMSKKTIYQHYEDKNKIVMAMIQWSIEDHSRQFAAFEHQAKNAIEEILLTMNYMKGIFAKTNPNMFFDMQRYHPDVWQLFRKFKEEKVFDMVIHNLEKGRAQGLYRADFNLKIIARLRLEEIELGMNPFAFPADKYKIHDVQVQILDHFHHGI